MSASNPFPELAPLVNVMGPEQRAALLASVVNMSDADAALSIEALDGHPVGRRTKWMRIGIGAAAGLAVGVIACKVMG